MTSGHFIYIPMILTVGLVFGFVLGGRFARDAYDMENKREIERQKARVEREARKAARKADEDKGGGGA